MIVEEKVDQLPADSQIRVQITIRPGGYSTRRQFGLNLLALDRHGLLVDLSRQNTGLAVGLMPIPRRLRLVTRTERVIEPIGKDVGLLFGPKLLIDLFLLHHRRRRGDDSRLCCFSCSGGDGSRRTLRQSLCHCCRSLIAVQWYLRCGVRLGG